MSRSTPLRGGVDLAVARRAFKQVWIGATVCAVAFGVTIASSALSYVSSFPTEASRQQIAATTGRDSGLSILLGPVSAIGTVGGYTVYKVFVFLTTVGAIWALLAATRLLRGEEDAGRWQVVLAGSTRPARATAATLAALAGAVGVVFAGTTLFILLTGLDHDVAFGIGESLLFGSSIAIVPAVFVAVGAVTSQLSRTRRGATTLGIATFGFTFVLRMIADSGPGTRWLLWLTPFGWSELMRPFTRNDLRPLVPVALTVFVLGGVALVLSSRRDVGDGVLASRDVARLRPFGLGSAFGMTVRRELPVLVAWCAGALASGAVLGVIAKVTTGAASESLNNALEKFNVKGGFAKQYLGVAFLLVATVVALIPAGQVGAAGDEETSGRLVHVLTRAPSRTAWFAGRLACCAVAVAAAGLLAGLAAYAGAASQGVNLALASMLGAGLNVVPTALVALGVGALVLAVAPRVAAGAVYGFIVASLVIDLSASLVTGLGWLEHLSLFHYMALAPAQHPDPSTLAVTTAIALMLCIGATMVFRARDLPVG
jgi:ABC-2 type transport system permease protein